MLINWFAVFFLLLATTAGQASDRAALVIGIGSYTAFAPLPNATRDARIVAAAFEGQGYRTILHTDLTHNGLLKALRDFRQTAGQAELTVIYFAGHGLLQNGQNLLFGADANISGSGSDVADTGVPLDLLVWAASNIPRQKILFVDACRNNTVSDQSRGQTSAPLPAGTYIGYAAQLGAEALDGPRGGNGPFARALSQMLNGPPHEIEDMMRRVRISVIQDSGGQQVPWSQSSLLLPIYPGALPRLGSKPTH